MRAFIFYFRVIINSLKFNDTTIGLFKMNDLCFRQSEREKIISDEKSVRQQQQNKVHMELN